jgi:hypothetical protein
VFAQRWSGKIGFGGFLKKPMMTCASSKFSSNSYPHYSSQLYPIISSSLDLNHGATLACLDKHLFSFPVRRAIIAGQTFSFDQQTTQTHTHKPKPRAGASAVATISGGRRVPQSKNLEGSCGG